MSKAFVKTLAERTSHFDAEFIADYHPQDSWIGMVTTPYDPDWWIVREKVRFIVEGDSFVPSEPVQHVTEKSDLFTAVLSPELRRKWGQ